MGAQGERRRYGTFFIRSIATFLTFLPNDFSTILQINSRLEFLHFKTIGGEQKISVRLVVSYSCKRAMIPKN